MTEDTDAAARYRQRAEELRVIAGEKQSKENRATLLKIARDYDAMADTMLAIDHTQQVLRKAQI